MRVHRGSPFDSRGFGIRALWWRSLWWHTRHHQPPSVSLPFLPHIGPYIFSDRAIGGHPCTLTPLPVNTTDEAEQWVASRSLARKSRTCPIGLARAHVHTQKGVRNAVRAMCVAQCRVNPSVCSVLSHIGIAPGRGLSGRLPFTVRPTAQKVGSHDNKRKASGAERPCMCVSLVCDGRESAHVCVHARAKVGGCRHATTVPRPLFPAPYQESTGEAKKRSASLTFTLSLYQRQAAPIRHTLTDAAPLTAAHAKRGRFSS